tara:strand:+ start:158 stop:394 length:237 start_codon:yes stop_codon:yes gene_type:complete
MTKYLYIVDHFIPFPRSEYGGIWNVIAKDHEECFDLIANEDDGLNTDCYTHLRENINKASAIVIGEERPSGIVEQFTT